MHEISAYHEAGHAFRAIYVGETSCPVTHGNISAEKCFRSHGFHSRHRHQPLRPTHSTVECDGAEDVSGLASASCGQLSADQRRDPLDGLVRQAAPTGSEEVRIGGRCINCTGFCTGYVRKVRISQGFLR